MTRFSLEVKVGVVVSITIALILAFLFFLGQYNPFAKSYRINVLYNFAGGIELGSPVRVAGVKVGKVDQIRFFEPGKTFQNEPVSISIRIQIDRRAKDLIREDSRFYINMAGIIGEKYIEINPGSKDAKLLENNATIRGIDPPRIDQFLSQGYSLFEKVNKKYQSLSEEDKAKIRSLFENLVKLTENLSEFGEKSGELSELASNLNAVMEVIAPKNQAEKKQLAQKLDQLSKTLDHIYLASERLDRTSARLETEMQGVTRQTIEKTIREILQQEGITINVGTMVGKPKYPLLPEPGATAQPGAEK